MTSFNPIELKLQSLRTFLGRSLLGIRYEHRPDYLCYLIYLAYLNEDYIVAKMLMNKFKFNPTTRELIAYAKIFSLTLWKYIWGITYAVSFAGVVVLSIFSPTSWFGVLLAFVCAFSMLKFVFISEKVFKLKRRLK
jgi:hypothetical protein